MFRKKLAGAQKERKDRITWRNHEVTRIEAFSDAVFAFAITLLIVSLEVPKSFDELFEGMRAFLPFALCFGLVFQIWMVQNVFFRRYGLGDGTTLVLNAMLVFMVLFFVYPLKFLFSSMFLKGFELQEADDLRKLFYIYSGGFAGIYLLFTLMYLNAYRHKSTLALTKSEAFETRTNVYRNGSMAAIGVLSILLAGMLNMKYVPLAGFAYILVGPVIGVLHSRRSKLHDRHCGITLPDTTSGATAEGSENRLQVPLPDESRH